MNRRNVRQTNFQGKIFFYWSGTKMQKLTQSSKIIFGQKTILKNDSNI